MSNPIAVGPCIRCREPIWMTAETKQTLLRSGAAFHCTFGHTQVFTAEKTEAQKLQEQLDAERRERQRAEQNVAYWQDRRREAQKEAEHQRRRANGYKGHSTKITKRAKAGVCPCCNRTFTNVARHMATQHPQFTPLEVIEGGKEDAA